QMASTANGKPQAAVARCEAKPPVCTGDVSGDHMLRAENKEAIAGLDHSVGHSRSLRVRPKDRSTGSQRRQGLQRHAACPKVADAVIEALFPLPISPWRRL